MLFVFFTLILSQGYNGVFQRVNDITSQHIEADLRIQSFSINLDIKKTYKNVDVTLLTAFFGLKIAIFHKNY